MRQRLILDGFAKGLTRKQIAGEIGVNYDVVRRECHNLYRLLEMQTDTALAVWWFAIWYTERKVA